MCVSTASDTNAEQTAFCMHPTSIKWAFIASHVGAASVTDICVAAQPKSATEAAIDKNKILILFSPLAGALPALL
jgi:hypothetical protein